MEIKKTCKNCGREFLAKNKRAEFCSSSCRVLNYQKKKKKKDVTRNKTTKILFLISVILLVLNLIFYSVPKSIDLYKNHKIEITTKNESYKDGFVKGRNHLRCFLIEKMSKSSADWIKKNIPKFEREKLNELSVQELEKIPD